MGGRKKSRNGEKLRISTSSEPVVHHPDLHPLPGLGHQHLLEGIAHPVVLDNERLQMNMSPGTAHSLKHCRQSLFPREEYLHFLIGRQKAVGTPEILHYDLVAAAHLLRYIVPVLELLHHLLAQLLPQPQITCSLTAEHLVLAEIASEEKIQQDTYVGQHKHHKNPGKSLDGVPLVGNQLHRRIHGDSDIQNVKRRCEYWPELR